MWRGPAQQQSFQALVEQGAIGQACQRIVLGKIAKPLFGGLARRNVRACAGEAYRHALRVAFDHAPQAANPDPGERAGRHPELGIECRRAAPERAFEAVSEPVAVVGMHAIHVHGKARRLFQRRLAAHRRGLRALIDAAALYVEVEQCRPRSFERQAEPLLDAGAQGGGLAAGRNVEREREQADHRMVGVPMRDQSYFRATRSRQGLDLALVGYPAAA